MPGNSIFALSATQKRTISSLRAAIGGYDDPGMAALHTFRSLKAEVEVSEDP